MSSIGIMWLGFGVSGSITIKMSEAQSVQFMRGVAGVMCLRALIGLGLWVLVGFLVGLGTNGCYGKIG
jgi:hypothetical protein